MPKVKKSKKETKSRGHVFTWHNWTEKTLEHLEKISTKCLFLCYGKELSPKTGSPHLQGYMYFTNSRLSKGVEKLMGGGWTEPAEGTPAQNHVYCSKDKEFTEYGTLPVQGARNDLSSFVTTVRDSEEKLGEETLLVDHTSVVARYPQFVDRVQRFFHPPQFNEERNNIWFVGPTHTGKTWRAKTYGTWYNKDPTHPWFDFYRDEEVVIIEDLEPGHIRKIGYFLKIWGDVAPFDCQIKNSTVRIRPKMLIVTSNYYPHQMGWDEDTLAAQLDRFEVIEMLVRYEKPGAKPKASGGPDITPPLLGQELLGQEKSVAPDKSCILPE